MADSDLMTEILSELGAVGPKSREMNIVKPRPRLVRPSTKIIEPQGLIGGGRTSSRLLIDDDDIGLGQIENLRAGRYRDEVDAYLDEKARAAHDAGGDEFYTRVQMQKQAVENLKDAAKFTRTNPLSVLNTLIGNTVSLLSGEEKEVARWSGTDEETMPVTVTIGSTQPPFVGVGAGVQYRPYARLQWGTAGFLVEAIIDLGLGAQFTVNASSVVLSMGINVLNAATPAFKATGMLSFRPCVRTAPITTSHYIIAPAGTTSAVTVIPQFAKSVMFWRTAAGSDVTIQLYNWGSGVMFGFTRAAAAGANETAAFDPILLPGEARAYDVGSVGAGSACKVVFTLDL